MTQNAPSIDPPAAQDAQVLNSLASDHRMVVIEAMLS